MAPVGPLQGQAAQVRPAGVDHRRAQVGPGVLGVVPVPVHAGEGVLHQVLGHGGRSDHQVRQSHHRHVSLPVEVGQRGGRGRPDNICGGDVCRRLDAGRLDARRRVDGRHQRLVLVHLVRGRHLASHPRTDARRAPPVPRPGPGQRARRATASGSTTVIRPRLRAMVPDSTSRRRTRFTVARVVPARPARSSWVRGMTAP